MKLEIFEIKENFSLDSIDSSHLTFIRTFVVEEPTLVFIGATMVILQRALSEKSVYSENGPKSAIYFLQQVCVA